MWVNITWLMTAHWSRLTLPEFQHPLLHISVFFLWIQPTLIRNITDCCNIKSLPVKTPFFSVFMMCSSMWLNHSVLGHSIFTYLLTPWCRVLLEKLTGLQLVKKFPTFHGTRRFIPALTSVSHLSLSWASPIQSIYTHPTYWRSVLILSAHLRLGLPSGLLPSGFPTKTLYTPLSSPIRATCPVHLILLDFITHTILGEEYKSFSSSLCNLLHSPVTSSLLGPNILLNTLSSHRSL